MQTEILKEDLRPRWNDVFLENAQRAIYGAPKRGKSQLRGFPILFRDYWLLTDSRRVALELSDASELPAAARDAALDLVPSALEWLLRVAEESPAAFDLTKGGDGKVYLRMREECAECGEDPAAVAWPPHHPQFCSQDCALKWLDDRAEDVPRFAHIDDLIGEAEAEATTKAYDAAKEEAAELHVGKVYADSDDNPLMRVIRLYGDDPTLTAEAAAWKLETAFRCGLLL